MRLSSVRARIAMAQALLMTSIIALAGMFGVIPDSKALQLKARKQVCETLAVNTAVLVNRNDIRGVHAALSSVVSRNPEMLSAALRSQNGKILAATAGHTERWDAELAGSKYSFETRL